MTLLRTPSDQPAARRHPRLTQRTHGSAGAPGRARAPFGPGAGTARRLRWPGGTHPARRASARRARDPVAGLVEGQLPALAGAVRRPSRRCCPRGRDPTSTTGRPGWGSSRSGWSGSPSSPDRPLPYIGDFPEINVRLYTVDDEGRRGVLFRSLEASRVLTVLGARTVMNVPYQWARMSIRRSDDAPPSTTARPGSPAPGRRRGSSSARRARPWSTTRWPTSSPPAGACTPSCAGAPGSCPTSTSRGRCDGPPWSRWTTSWSPRRAARGGVTTTGLGAVLPGRARAVRDAAVASGEPGCRGHDVRGPRSSGRAVPGGCGSSGSGAERSMARPVVPADRRPRDRLSANASAHAPRSGRS